MLFIIFILSSCVLFFMLFLILFSPFVILILCVVLSSCNMCSFLHVFFF
jgi:hypothetical protein